MKFPARHQISNALMRRAGWFDRSFRQTIGGSTFTIPIINGRKARPSEPWMLEVIRRTFLMKSGAFLDVGVNMGQTLLKVASIDRRREYLGFEPNPTCVDYTLALISANNLPFRIVPTGLGASTDILTLSLDNDETDSSASLVPGFRQRTAAIQRSVIVLPWTAVPDNLKPEQVGIVKIDVEGGELEVLQGLGDLLTDHRPAILMEILPSYDAGNTARIRRSQAIEQILLDADYRMFRIIRSENGEFTHFKRLSQIEVHGNLTWSDYLMVPKADAMTI